jgi:hypothetical protein
MVTAKKAPVAPELPYVVVRDHRSGVYAGRLEHHNQIAKTAILLDARKIWFWKGRLDTGDIALRGVGEGSKMVDPVPKKELNEVVDISHTTPAGETALKEFPSWRA